MKTLKNNIEWQLISQMSAAGEGKSLANGLEINDLRGQRAHGSNRLRTGMVKRDKQRTLPLQNPRDMGLQCEFVRLDQFESGEGDRSDRGYDLRAKQPDLALEEVGAVCQLSASGPVVCSTGFTRAAEHAIRYEDIVAGQAYRIEKLFEVDAGSVTVEWNTSAISTVPTRCLGNEHQPRR